MIKLKEKQLVDGEFQDIGTIIETDAMTENVLVAHGKAEFVQKEVAVEVVPEVQKSKREV